MNNPPFIIPFDNEPCSPMPGQSDPGYYSPRTPPDFALSLPPDIRVLDLSSESNRLVPQLRRAAAGQDPVSSLAQSAVEYFQAMHQGQAGIPPGANTAMATALADLAVTGRNSFMKFVQNNPSTTDIVNAAMALLPGLGQSDATTGANFALGRAWSVIVSLSDDPSTTNLTPATVAMCRGTAVGSLGLGWVAVSGEDDPPHRPVNVLSAPFYQYDLPVTVPTPLGPAPSIQLVVRYMVAPMQPAAAASTPTGASSTTQTGGASSPLPTGVFEATKGAKYSTSSGQAQQTPQATAAAENTPQPRMMTVSRPVKVTGGGKGAPVATAPSAPTTTLERVNVAPKIDLSNAAKYVTTLPPQIKQTGLKFIPQSSAGATIPDIPDGVPIIIFLHGDGSRLEESLSLVFAFQQWATSAGTAFTIIAFDGPNSGYTVMQSGIPPVFNMFDHQLVAPYDPNSWSGNPLSSTPANPSCPILDFTEASIFAFIDALDALVPIKNRIAAIIGGSLGGNMALRLAAPGLDPSHPRLIAPGSSMWPQNVVAWSPASAWKSFQHDAILSGPTGGFGASNGLNGMANSLQQAETPGSRDAFFVEVYQTPLMGMGTAVPANVFSGGLAGVQYIPPQPQTWWRTDWPCMNTYIQNSLADREEIYNSSFRRWHYRQDLEQLLFSQYNTDTPTGAPRYTFISIPLLLATGDQDIWGDSGNESRSIFTNTKQLMSDMAANNIDSDSSGLVFQGIGHSIHDESPTALARNIGMFLSGTPLG